MTDQNNEAREQRDRRIEFSTVVECEGENYLDEEGEVDEEQMIREGMAYVEEAARNGALDVEITQLDDMER